MQMTWVHKEVGAGQSVLGWFQSATCVRCSWFLIEKVGGDKWLLVAEDGQVAVGVGQAKLIDDLDRNLYDAFTHVLPSPSFRTMPYPILDLVRPVHTFTCIHLRAHNLQEKVAVSKISIQNNQATKYEYEEE